MKPTDIKNPDYFHKVVDCQWACPAHTPVPEYIRLIAHGRYSDAYMINWKSNVFPGILGRTCDRPCEPACRRSRVEDEHLVKGKKEPVAICRLKRVAADYKDDEGIKAAMPKAPDEERQAHRLHRRRPRLAHRGARPRRAGLRDRHLRPGSQARRLHPHPDPALPPARVGDRRGSRLHHRHRQHRVPPSEDRLDEGGPGRRLRRGVRRLGRAARPRPRRAGPQGSRRQHPYRPRLAVVGLVRPHHARSASA